MTPTQGLILGLYAAIVAAWPLRHLVVSILFRKFEYLTRGSPTYSAPDPPPVTAIIPARDEEATLADCLESVRRQSYPNLDIVVVDDRSRDGTSAIAARFAAADPRVTVLTIAELPAGWTGKTHALHVASARARGDWLWFLDADTRHTPESLSVVMEYARSHGASLASLIPEMRCETFWERVVQPLMGIVLMRSFPLFRVNSARRPIAFANGQYLLVERSAYEAVGGHEAVRERFVEDISLAERIKRSGRRIRVAVGPEISSTRMYASLPQIVQGWSRILYDALGRKPWPLVGKIVEPLIFSQTALIALVIGLASLSHSTAFSFWMLALAFVHLLLQISVLYRMYRMTSPTTAWSAVWYPLAGFISDWILIKAIIMCATGRVIWRGTSYRPSGGGAEERMTEDKMAYDSK